MKEIRKVLTFRASAIGDALNAKYLLENVHAAYPDARCGLIVASRGTMIRDLLAAYPWIEVLEVNRKNIPALVMLWKRFGGSDVVVLPPTKPGASFALPSKIAARLLARPGGLYGFGDASRFTRFIYDRILTPDPLRAPRLLEQQALTAAGVPISVPSMTLAYLPQPNLLARLDLTKGKYLVLHLFAGSNGRAMSNEKRQVLIDALAHAMPNVPLILTGSVAERRAIEQLTLPTTTRVVAGDLSVQELAALIASSGCMVSVGTGPSHMASHLKTPLLVLVVCVGITWCGPEQFGDAAGRIFSDTAACANGHDHSLLAATCIEGIDVQEVARAAATYFK